MKLGHILQSSIPVHIELDHFRSDELKRAARFWVGKEAVYYKKDKCIAALTRVMNGDDAARCVPAALSEKERQVLAIFTRYGPTVSGGVLTAEMYARGLVQLPPKDRASEGYYPAYYEWRRNDLIRGLGEKLVLVGNAYDMYYSSSDTHGYPQSTLHPALVKAVAPAPPLPWNASSACHEAVGTGRRSSAEVALDLWRVAAVLRSMGTWPTVKGDSPAKATRTRMQKEVGLRDAEKDPLSPPDPESFFYELLHSMGLMNFGGKPSWIHQEALERHLQQPPAAQAWHWVRAWLHMPLWQDGIGVVPERDSDYASVRIEPSKLYHARELLAWALCGVAQSSGSTSRPFCGTSGGRRRRLRSTCTGVASPGIRNSRWLEKRTNIPRGRTARWLTGSPARRSGRRMPLWSRWPRLDWSNAARRPARTSARVFA
jgi:hypothetical protein